MARYSNPYNKPDAVDGAPVASRRDTERRHRERGPGTSSVPAHHHRPNPTTYTYFVFSRNGTQTGAYGIFYRKTSGSVKNLAFFCHPEPQEGVVVMSARRMKANWVSFGHGEVFDLFRALGAGARIYRACDPSLGLRVTSGDYSAIIQLLERP